MQLLIDCQILEYTYSSETLEEDLSIAMSALLKPIYTIPVLELCRAVDLLAKEHHFDPQFFCDCYLNFSAKVEEILVYEGSPIHILEFDEDSYLDGNLPLIITNVMRTDNAPIMDISCSSKYSDYWDSHLELISNLRRLYDGALEKFEILAEKQRPWKALPPYPMGKDIQVIDRSKDSLDILLDTNNFLELANRLPVDEVYLTLPYLPPNTGLPQSIQQRFEKLFKSRGCAKFIVPISVLEEAFIVAMRDEKYNHVIEVIKNMALSPEKWSPYFYFDPLNQEIFDYYLYLYSSMYKYDPDTRRWPGFGDLLVLAHGLYHGCQIASNQWFWKKRHQDYPEWHLIGEIFPYLVLQPPKKE